MNAPLDPVSAGEGFIPEIEQNLLGALLGGGDHAKVFSLLTSENFVEPVHGEIFRLIESARSSYGSTTLPVVARMIPDDLAKAFQLSTGGPLTGYMAKLLSETLDSAATSAKTAKAVLNQWARIIMGREAARTSDAVRDPGANPLELMRAAAHGFDDIASQLRVGSQARTQMAFSEAAGAAMADAREARRRGGLVGLTTGLVDLDRLLGGLQRRDLILVAARPSMGKTMIGTTFARAAAEAGIGAGFLSLEMDAKKLAARMVSDIGHQRGLAIPYQDIINGAASESELAALDDALQHYRALPLLIEDQTSLTVFDIRTKAEDMIAKAEAAGVPLGLLVIDHLHKIKPSSRYSGNRANEVSEITDGLKALAREHDTRWCCWRS